MKYFDLKENDYLQVMGDPNAVIYDEDGRPESWQDRIMIPAMLKLIQDQKKQLDALQAEVDALKAKLQ